MRLLLGLLLGSLPVRKPALSVEQQDEVYLFRDCTSVPSGADTRNHAAVKLHVNGCDACHAKWAHIHTIRSFARYAQ